MDKKIGNKKVSAFISSVCLILGLGLSSMSYANEVQPESSTPMMTIEKTAKSADETAKQANTEGKVDINSASLDELMALKGIGKSKAQAIIDYREKIGRFTSLDQLEKVFGIGVKLIEQNKDAIFIN